MTPTGELRIRSAAPTDLAKIVAFNAAMALETEAKMLDGAKLTEGVRQALADPRRCRYYVAERGGEVVGQTMVTFEWSDWRNGDFWWIQSVYVDPAHRRGGVFRAIYEHIRDAARNTPGVCGLRLYAHSGNSRALGAYESLGMTVTNYVVCEEDWS